MAKEQKSPQQKKELEFSRDHFTFSEHPHAFRRNWKRKKTQANREVRRKSDELLAQAKPEMPAADVELIAGEITVAQLAKSVLRKRLRKGGTVSVGEKVKLKVEKRAEMIGRRVQSQKKFDSQVVQAVSTLRSLEGERLVDFVRSSSVFLDGGDPLEWNRVKTSNDPIDRALSFLEGLVRGDARLDDALCRNRELREVFRNWVNSANRILVKDQRVVQRKTEQRRSSEKKIKAHRREAESKSASKHSAQTQKSPAS